MGSYSQFIADARRPQPTPASLADQKGTCSFGTFAEEFQQLNLLQVRKPTWAPQALNAKRLTLWEASEINLPQGVLLTGVCNMGLFGKMINLWYDKRTRSIVSFDATLPVKDTVIAPNLLDHAVCEGKAKAGSVRYENDFGHGQAMLSGRQHSGKNEISYHFVLTAVSQASIVSIPFGSNRPLYTEKQIFRVSGALTLNGETITADESTAAVIDDHRGYYPRRMHYDWLTTMGCSLIDGRWQPFGFNLTRNQSTDQEKYNENLIWLENRSSLLPPVHFRKTPATADFKGVAEWQIRDEHDMVHADLTVLAVHPTVAHAGIIQIDYYIVFGILSGWLRDEDGRQYSLDGLAGIGEDKSMLF